MVKFAKTHPLLSTALAIVVIGFPQWIQAIWGLWSADPLLPLIAARLKAMSLPTFSAYWLTIPLGLLMFGVIWYEIRRSREPRERDLAEGAKRFREDLQKRAQENRLKLAGLYATPAIDRISVLDLFKEAERQGLRFMGSGDDILQFVADLRQAGSDGTLTFWGRERRQRDPLIKIPAGHWREFSIDWRAVFELGPPSGIVKGFQVDNFPVGSRTIDHRAAFFDLHADRVPALAMMRSQVNEKQRAVSTPIPDWSIRELFYYLQPTLKGGDDTKFEATGLEVKDALSTGQLKIWGRSHNFHGDVLPLFEIDPTYWHTRTLLVFS